MTACIRMKRCISRMETRFLIREVDARSTGWAGVILVRSGKGCSRRVVRAHERRTVPEWVNERLSRSIRILFKQSGALRNYYFEIAD